MKLEGYNILKDTYGPCPEIVRLRFGKGGNDYLEISVRDDNLEVRSGSQGIMVLPRSSNVVEIAPVKEE